MCNQCCEAISTLRKCVRVMSHIKDMTVADPLRYVPISAYKEALRDARAFLNRVDRPDVNCLILPGGK